MGWNETNPKSDLWLEIAQNKRPGLTSEFKFGRNPAVGTSKVEVWDGLTAYVFYPTAAVAVDLTSSDGSDSQVYKIIGLDGEGSPVETTVTADGLNAVEVDTLFWRVFRVSNENTTDNVGDIDIIARNTGSGVSAGNVAARISAGFNQTLMALRTVPKGFRAFVVDWAVSFDTGAAGANVQVVNVDFCARENTSVSSGGVFKIKDHHGLVSRGSSALHREFRPYMVFPELTDLAIIALSTVAGTDVHADINMILEELTP